MTREEPAQRSVAESMTVSGQCGAQFFDGDVWRLARAGGSAPPQLRSATTCGRHLEASPPARHVPSRGRAIGRAWNWRRRMDAGEFSTIQELAEVAPLVRRPVEIDPTSSYPELGVRSFGRGTFHKPDLPGAEVGSKKLFRIRTGDLVFNIVFAWEGAVAVAKPADEGRVGSHRFLTCVPEADTATVEFLRFYFSTSEGLQKLGEASPRGAGRNRTLGLKKLEVLEVPVPPISQQQWFDRLQAKAHEARSIRAKTAEDIEALIPAMLNELFGTKEQAA